MTTLHNRLVHAVTSYDRRMAGRRGYNPYALAQYLARIENVEADIAAGATVRAALLAAFSDRLLDAVLVGVGEPKFTLAERDGQFGRVTYQPTARKE